MRPPSPTQTSKIDAPERWQESRPEHRGVFLAAVAAIIIVTAIGIVTVATSDGDLTRTAESPPTAEPTVTVDPTGLDGDPLELNLGALDPTASCLRPDAATLATMSPAFRGTATEIDGELITLMVDEWYAGGDTTAVELRLQPGMEALIAGFSVEIGEQYAIAANAGSVNLCGFSGPITPELDAMYAEAFPS